MAERNLSTNLKKLLINNEPFAYCHLIKFERPSKALLDGSFSTDAVRYAYYTDASYNVAFDDQSKNMDGNGNGSQTYVADKIMDVSSYSETVEARASGMTLTFSSESLNNIITNNTIVANASASTLTVPSYISLTDEGFREGDKILITGGSMNGKHYRINGIKTNNTVISLGVIDDAVINQSSGTTITIKVVSDELKGPLGEINDGSLKSYHNREVFVYKAFLDADSGVIVGSPVMVFKGIINSTSITDNPTKGLLVKWMLTSHWGDFAAVRGRISNDKIHRAADANNRGQPEAAIRPEYANDLGFMHSEQTTNILAVYTAIEQELEIKTKKKLFKTKVNQQMVDVEVERDVNLNFSLQGKYLPVVYGVERIAGLPIFVDTKSNDANNIFIAYALCEGEIAGLFDVYIDGSPTVCINKEDSDDRDDTVTTPDDGIEVFCRGRQDLGTTVGGVKRSGSGVSGSTGTNYDYNNGFKGYGIRGWQPEAEYIDEFLGKYHTVNSGLSSLTATDVNGAGVVHGETLSLSSPNTIHLTMHTGKRDQKADDTLVSIAQSPKFKRQADYFASDSEYWSPNHRLLDTAYIVMDCEIADDATTVPEIEYVVRGKEISSYNYDYSYDHSGAGSQAATNFKVGDKVDLKRTDTNAIINDDVIIIDKWTFTDSNKNVRSRFRFSTAPNLGYSDGVPAITAFYMTDGTNRWDMVTYNYVAHSGTVPATLTIDVTVSGSAGSAMTVATGTNPNWLVGGFYDFSALYNFAFTDPNEPYYDKSFGLDFNSTTGTHTGGDATGVTTGTKTIVSKDRIKLASGASATNDAYNGMRIEVTKTVVTDGVKSNVVYTREVVDYLGGSEKVVTVSQPWAEGQAPDPDDEVIVDGAVFTYKLLPAIKQDDKRVSINPAIQLLDYMTSPIYGKGLDKKIDISMSDFLQAARTCDTRGTQTLCGNKTPTVGHRYVLTVDGASSGAVVAQGLVKSKGDFSDSAGTDYTVFEEVFGKFTKKFMKNTHSYELGDIVFTGKSTGYYRCTTAGAKSTEPTHASGQTANGFKHITAIPLYRNINGSIDSTAVNYSRVLDGIYLNPLAEYNVANKSFDTGYSLFDSDFVQYWRYLGWNSPHQRNVTRHQTSCVIDTSQSVFENINAFLGNFNGMLSYEAGKYALRVETTSDAIVSDIATSSDTGYTKGSEINPRNISEQDIIGTIKIDDKGPSKSYNTVSTSILDPGNQFKGTAVTFYDSNYLRADKNVIKSGTVNIASVASYYNARINVENFLRKSRFGMTISFKIGPKSLLLLPGDTIAITHNKFGFSGKKFRITNISFQKDCSASIQASEYDDSFYTISKPSLPSISGNDQRSGITPSPGTPSNLSATAKAVGSIDLAWTNTTSFTDNMFTEIYVSPNSNAANRTLLHKTQGITRVYQHNVGEDGAARYYWIRHGKSVVLTSGGSNKVKVLYSAFHGSANATTVIPSSLYDVILESDANVFNANSSGTIQTPSSIALTAKRHNLAGSVTFSTAPTVTLTGSGDTRALSKANMGSNALVVITATVTSSSAERAAGADDTYTSKVTVSRVNEGATGAAGTGSKSVQLTAADYSIVYDAAGSNPNPGSSIVLTAASQDFTNGFFRFTGDGISDEGSYSDGSSANGDTFSFPVPSSHFTTPKTLRVGIAEGNQTEVAFDTISIFAVKPGAAGSAGADGDDAFTVICSNEAHAIPANVAGSPTSYSGTGTTFEVFRGSTQLTGVLTGTPSSSQFKVTVTDDTNITKSSNNGASVSSKIVIFADHNSCTAATASITYSINVANTQTVTKKQTFTKTQTGATGAAGEDGDNGDAGATGPRTIIFRLNHTAAASSAPTAPASGNTNSFNFGNGTLGTILSGWSHSTPTYASGNSNKYWYVDVTVVEAAFNGSQTISFGSTTQAIGFSGLVTFSNSSTLTNGSTSFSPIIGSQVNANVTAISGGSITTGTIAAARLSTDLLRVTGDALTGGTVGGITINSSKIFIGTGTHGNSNTAFYVDNSGKMSLKDKFVWDGTTLSINGNITIGNASAVRSTLNVADGATDDSTANGKTTASAAATAANSANKTGGTLGGWSIDNSAIFSGTKDTSGYTASNGHITISSSGSIHTPKFFVNADGSAGFRGTLTIGSTDLSATNTLNTNTTAGDVGLGSVNNDSTATIRAVGAATSGTVAAWTISANKISNSKIEIDNANERILIKDS